VNSFGTPTFLLSSPPSPSGCALPGGGTHTAGGRSPRAAPSTVPALLIYILIRFWGVMASFGVARSFFTGCNMPIFHAP